MNEQQLEEYVNSLDSSVLGLVLVPISTAHWSTAKSRTS
jgi:hypothetical protein